MPALSLTETLLTFVVQCLVLSGAGVAAQVWRRRLTGTASTATGAGARGHESNRTNSVQAPSDAPSHGTLGVADT